MSQYYAMQTVPGYGPLLALLGCVEPNARGEQRPTRDDTGTGRKELAGWAVCSSALLGYA